MRRIVSACLLVSVGACASNQQATDLGPSAASTTAVIQGGTIGSTAMALANTASASKSSVNLPIDKAWAALDKAYTVMTIAPTERNNTTHMLGNSAFRVRRKLGDVPLIKALDCGGDNSSPNAETYDITLTIHTRLTAQTPTTTQIETLIEGTGKNTLTNNLNPVTCYSTGGIEKRLTELMTQAAGQAPPEETSAASRL